MRTQSQTKTFTAKIKDIFWKQKGKLENFSLFIRNRKILFPLILGAAIRFSAAPFTEQRWDMYIWRLNQAFVYHYRINPFWPTQALEFAWGYPPLWLLTLLLVYPFYIILFPTSYPQEVSLLWNSYNSITDPQQRMATYFESYWRFLPPPQGNVQGLNLPILDLIIKTPIIISDLIVALILYKIVASLSNEKNAKYAYLAWLFNPYVIWISSVWGMFDSIPTLFMLLSIYYLTKNNFYKSAIMLATSTLFKLYPALFIPIFTLIVFKKRRKFKEAIKFFLISIGIIFSVIFVTYLAFAFYAGQEPLSLSIKLTYNIFVKRASPDWEGRNIIAGLTPLYFLSDKIGATNIPLSPLLISIALALTLIKLGRQKELTTEDILSYATAAHFIIYLTYTVVNPQYFIWVLPLILILAAEKNAKLKYLYWAVSIIPLSVIFCSYDLSYFFSPYFVSGYLKICISPEYFTESVALAIFYIACIKLAFIRKSSNQKTSKL